MFNCESDVEFVGYDIDSEGEEEEDLDNMDGCSQGRFGGFRNT